MPVSSVFKEAVAAHVSNLETASIGGGDPNKNPEKIKIEDTRTKLLSTGAKVDKGQMSGEYDTGRIKNIIKAAKHIGVDPNTALSVALQETHIGNKNSENVGNVYAGYAKAPEGLDQQSYELAAFLKEKMTEGKDKLKLKDEAMQIQMFNGLGKLFPQKINNKPIPTKYYGIEVTEDKPLDLKKNPLYGKTVIDLRDNVIKKNEYIQKLISTL